ncbi:MAG: T9SS type A sorting domain-containing protein [Calditrichaeota bacterium]|nr:T9SS type A sorting domain-containing protein [Calditrichota bacterium]
MEAWYDNKTAVLSLIIFKCLLALSFAYSQTLYSERPYQPVVLRGGVLSTFFDVPVDSIYMYVYSDSAKSWHMIPFQIDERILAEDPFKPGNEGAYRHSYFIPDDGVLDLDDELVFLVGDLGDPAPAESWIEDADSRRFERLQIRLWDQDNPQIEAYGYLYRSSTITEPIPHPYNFSCDPTNDIVSNVNYQVRMSKQNGLIEDIVVKPPLGTGVDIFDTQKIRFEGVFEGMFIYPIVIGGDNSPAANERDNLYVYPDYYKHTADPVVRVVREVRQTIRFGIPFEELAFYVTTRYYPFSGTVAGGADLNPEKLKEEFQTNEDIYIQLFLLRQSIDFNSNATGMKYYSRYNENVIINGVPDEVNKTIDVPIKEWSLVTGDQGSVFTQIEFEDTSWQSIELYYYDNSEGGQGDGTLVEGGDTGDRVSYGDEGILFRDLAQDSVNLTLGFQAYFLPANLQKEDGEKIASWLEKPLYVQTSAESFLTSVSGGEFSSTVQGFELAQNYPNPFNGTTKISFKLGQPSHVTLKIFNLSGQLIRILTNENYGSGTQQILWDGKNQAGEIAASGVYYYQITTETGSQMKKMVFLQ